MELVNFRKFIQGIKDILREMGKILNTRQGLMKKNKNWTRIPQNYTASQPRSPRLVQEYDLLHYCLYLCNTTTVSPPFIKFKHELIDSSCNTLDLYHEGTQFKYRSDYLSEVLLSFP